MTSALFVTFEAGGNVHPALGLAQRLVAEGGRALVLGTPSQRTVVAAAGLEFEPFSLEQPYRTLAPVNPVANLSQVSRTLGSWDIARDVVQVARRESPAVGRRVQESGAGRILPAKTSVADLRQAIAALAAPGQHRLGAVAVGARLRALDPAGDAVAYLGADLPAASR